MTFIDRVWLFLIIVALFAAIGFAAALAGWALLCFGEWHVVSVNWSAVRFATGMAGLIGLIPALLEAWGDD